MLNHRSKMPVKGTSKQVNRKGGLPEVQTHKNVLCVAFRSLPKDSEFHHRIDHLTADRNAFSLFSRFELRSPSKYLRRPGAEAKPLVTVC